MSRPCRFRRSALASAIALGMCTSVFAQTSMTFPQTGSDMQIPQTMRSMDGDGAAQQPSTRSLFLTTIAMLVAQGIGSGLSQGLGGSIMRWFSSDDGTAQRTGSGAEPGGVVRASDRTSIRRQEQGVPDSGQALQAGLAWEVHRLDPRGGTALVDTERHVFRTGDQFVVHFRPTLPGRVDIVNQAPDGTRTNIDVAQVAAGELVTLGPYQFADRAGVERLIIVAAPCSTPELMATTRSIVKVSATTPVATPLVARCDDAGSARSIARARTIRKVTTDGSTRFALDTVTPSERQTGRFDARAVEIRLVHR